MLFALLVSYFNPKATQVLWVRVVSDDCTGPTDTRDLRDFVTGELLAQHVRCDNGDIGMKAPGVPAKAFATVRLEPDTARLVVLVR